MTSKFSRGLKQASPVILSCLRNRCKKQLRDAVAWCEDRNFDKKAYWWQLIQLLPSSYNQRRTVMLNYEVLTNIYHYRKDHKLDEWHTLCDWIEKLPYSELITGNYAEEYPY